MSETGAEKTPSPRSEVYAILMHASEPRVLALPKAGGWSLPHFTRVEGWPPMVGDVTPAIRELLKVEAHVLRCVHYHNGGEEGEETIYVLEYGDPFPQPPHGRWLSRAELPALIPSAHRAVIAGWLDEYEGGTVPPQRPPWQCPGWHATATRWILDRLLEVGTPATGPVEQIKNWGISCVLRAPTERGDTYFKAVPPLFAQEPVITSVLAAAHPRRIPAPIAIDPENRWMLLPDIAGTLLYECLERHGNTALRELAHIQMYWTGRGSELLGLGLPDRRLAVLRGQIDLFVENEAVARGLEDDEYARLRSLVPGLKQMCEGLARYAIPETLVHGDCHAGNIAVRNGDVVFFDWTDACVAHPFFDPHTLLAGTSGSTIDITAQKVSPDAYLEPWTVYEPLDRLREAYALAEPLAALHQAISYEHIVRALEPASKIELESGIGGWLKGLLKIMQRVG